VELSYAVKAGLPYGRVQNAAGSFVEANDQSIAAATSAAANETSSDFRYSITNPHSSTAYPIASFTWMVIPAAPSSPQKQPAVKDFLRWILGDGQEYVKSSGMVRLPEELAGKERRALP
jgi:phosphate transport system substrate-binding protein